MERTVPQSIGDILRNVFRDSCMDQRLNECKAVELWGNVIGENIASQCRKPRVENGLMTIGVVNASLRHELTMNRSAIRDSINRLIGKETLKDIRFIS